MGQALTPRSIAENRRFIGRTEERRRLAAIMAQDDSAILVVHGRRRVGKTELIEQAFRRRKLLKFEGVEGKDAAYQRRHFLRQLARYAGDPAIAALDFTSWLEIFEYLARYVSRGVWTLFFEEVQWLSCYDSTFVAELKHAWDNQFRYNPKLILVLCGSSPSFMIGKVLKSKALYNRSIHGLSLAPFSLAETRAFLGERRSRQQVMDGYLSVGGIPEYLKYLKKDSSVFLALCRNSFVADSFFSEECGKVFVSSLAKNPNYRAIVDFLAGRRHATRAQIAAHLKRERGGTLTTLLEDLELCHFIERFRPFNLGAKSKLARYAIRDGYLQFYYKFIHDRRAEISRGTFDRDPAAALPANTYYIWLGYAFERYCRDNAWKLARFLGFGAVSYTSGVFYNRATEKEHPGYQIDLVFERADRVYTLCEIKYLRGPATREVVVDYERKLALFPNPQKRTIQRVLISAHGAEPSVANGGFFDRIVTLDDIFEMEKA